ncbi:hypothetical protein [Burkholderia multivorans]|uniref:hypothetical protein n=1 Tax=Burkholderia multivorans TaxID=87883 RepID=UPI001B98563E|nr:hypothetical protein [Burkholderia multivorans]MBR8019522.1 hypothetical protein [Burkholderia multivorans]MBU9647825.1 hypothetical protein [Burkholderia multivorans]MDN7756772.1 hypothetical protein [Burkholderia multivorans]MDN8008219.1 hypothetical protein [Burkholderia multivorans]HEF4730008.1 hypothetical protein [Burkholderia multivorans]
MSNYEKLRDAVLGYDDAYRSTQDERDVYWCVWNTNWWPGRVIDLTLSKVIARSPRHEGEKIAVDLTRAAIEKAARSAKEGGRPAN